MKKLLLWLPLCLLAAPPALATQGMTCRTASGPGIEMSIVFGAQSSAFQPRLTVAGRNVPVVVAQSWLEDLEFRFDLTDPQARRRELRIKVRRNGPVFDGSAWRNGKRYWVRCREG